MSSKLKINEIYAEKISFDRNMDYDGNQEDVDVKFDLDVLLNAKDSTKGAVRVKCDINADKQEESQYVLQVTMFAEFEAEDDAFESFALNAVSILLPYLRAQVSTITSNAGVEPVILPALNVFDMFKKKAEEAEAELAEEEE